MRMLNSFTVAFDEDTGVSTGISVTRRDEERDILVIRQGNDLIYIPASEAQAFAELLVAFVSEDSAQRLTQIVNDAVTATGNRRKR